MNTILILVVLVLLAIALKQLSGIYNVTQLGKKQDNSEIANDKDNNTQGVLMFVFLGFIYVFTIYSLVKWGKFVLSIPASEHGVDSDRLLWISFALIFFVQTITQALLHYFAYKYRGRDGQKATFFADSGKLEAVWTIIPAVTLAGLILYGLYTWTEIMFVDEDNEDVMIVEIYAKQFGWEVRYAGEDNVLGKANVRYIEGINTLGVDEADPYAQDDIQSNELYLPKGKRVVFKIRSQDVLHSAYMPHFRAQMNCVPGMVTQFSFVPTMTTIEMREQAKIKEKVANINKIRTQKSQALMAKGEEPLDPYEFDFLLLCNKICGSSHYNMQMKIVVTEEQNFKDWLAQKTTFGAAIKAQKEQNQPSEELLNEVEVPAAVDTLNIAMN